jgi:outer membrane protein W
MKHWLQNTILAAATLIALAGFGVKSAHAREGFSVGAQVIGNFFLTDGTPDLDPGIGGGLYFDYRFNQRWSIETDLFVSFHDGTGVSAGDNNQMLLGVPTVELKFYLRGKENSIDPYLLAGLGVYVLTEGSIGNNSSGVGLGGNFGMGVDFYVLDSFSLGLAAKFRPIALIQGNNQSTGLINLGILGNLAWHF